MIAYLILIPILAGLAAFFIRPDFVRRGLLITASCVHLALTVILLGKIPYQEFNGWFAIGPLNIIFLGIISLLFFGVSVYGISYLSGEKNNTAANEKEGVFTGCLLLFLGAMTASVTSQHLAVIWVSMETTTLVSAPLIYFHRSKLSVEATWKYLLICSVGIALALLGILFLGVACLKFPGTMLVKDLVLKAPGMDSAWLKAAFIFLFIGYGTKMGLAPLHTWLPDAHSEAPSMVSALLSGALLNCAFLAVLRVYQVCSAAGLGLFCREIFVLFGLLSIVFAAFFILVQSDYKRMLAYSSVEHMGILALGIGAGGGAVFGVILNTISHSLTKAGLFLIAGNLLSHYRTKYISGVKGILSGKLMYSGVLWITGFFLITGVPPSGIFLGKYIILKNIIEQGRYWFALIFLAALAVIFIGMARIFISMVYGAPQKEQGDKAKEGLSALVPSGIFFAIVIVLGIYLPVWLNKIICDASLVLGGF